MGGRVIHLLRHGPPLVTGLLLGHTDMPLAVENSPGMPSRFHELPLAAIVSSDLRRCREPAQQMAQALDLPHRNDPDWRELNFGEWDGLVPSAVDQDRLAQFQTDPETCPPPGGERWSQICARVRRGMERLAGQTLVLTHAGAIRAALAVATGLDYSGVWAVDLPYGAMLSLRLWQAEGYHGQMIGLDAGQPA